MRFSLPARPRRRGAFTLVEMLVAMGVLSLLIVMVAQLFSSAVAVTTLDSKRIDADEQARTFFDRMAVDFARMVRRTDVDYYLKQPTNTMLKSASNLTGNDQIAFYSEVPGYYPASGSQSPVSLVAYRVNTDQTSGNYSKAERLGKGLVWNGVSTTDAPVLFLPVPLASPLASPLPSPMPMPSPSPAWPQAGNSNADPHGDYELLGPEIFRLEYYYLLKGQTVGGTNYDSTLSDTPWDARIAGHATVAGWQDVAAVVVAIAVIDPRSRVLVTGDQLASLASTLPDFGMASTPIDPLHSKPLAPGALPAYWETAVDKAASGNVAGFPRAAARSVRIYHRYFYL